MTAIATVIHGVFPQDLTIRIRGADVLALAEHASPDEEAPIPDLGDLLVTAARFGLLAGASAPPWAAAVEVLSSEAELRQREQRWRLRLDRIDPGVFRVLLNVLAARDLEQVSLLTDAPPGTVAARAPLLQPARIAYPAVHGKPPFELEVEPPARSGRDRAIEVVFQRPPPDAVGDRLLQAFRTWTELLMLGGYPEEGMDPKNSGCFPDEPFQLDELAFRQDIPEHFAADEAAFNAIVNVAIAIHRAGQPIAQVVIR
jgi:hypothetical protein